MPNFDQLFLATDEKAVKYDGKVLVRYDEIPFDDGDRFLITIQKTNSKWVQGIGLLLFGFIEIETIKETVSDRTFFMENAALREIVIRLWKDNTKRKQPKSLPQSGFLGIKNVWDNGSNRIDSWFGGAAMIVEETENGKRYRCNDGHPDENFDDIVFTVQKVNA
jgi:hypothetical protein